MDISKFWPILRSKSYRYINFPHKHHQQNDERWYCVLKWHLYIMGYIKVSSV